MARVHSSCYATRHDTRQRHTKSCQRRESLYCSPAESADEESQPPIGKAEKRKAGRQTALPPPELRVVALEATCGQHRRNTEKAASTRDFSKSTVVRRSDALAREARFARSVERAQRTARRGALNPLEWFAVPRDGPWRDGKNARKGNLCVTPICVVCGLGVGRGSLGYRMR